MFPLPRPPPLIRPFPLPRVQHVLESVFRDINAGVDGGDADADGTGPVEWTVKGLKVDLATPADLAMDTGFVLEAFLPVARIGTIFRRLLSEPTVVFDQIVLLASSSRTEAGQLLRKGIYTWRYPDPVSREFRVVDHTDAFARATTDCRRNRHRNLPATLTTVPVTTDAARPRTRRRIRAFVRRRYDRRRRRARPKYGAPKSQPKPRRARPNSVAMTWPSWSRAASARREVPTRFRRAGRRAASPVGLLRSLAARLPRPRQGRRRRRPAADRDGRLTARAAKLFRNLIGQTVDLLAALRDTMHVDEREVEVRRQRLREPSGTAAAVTYAAAATYAAATYVAAADIANELEKRRVVRRTHTRWEKLLRKGIRM